jgi:LPXTG-motif cell wall-anchored protein
MPKSPHIARLGATVAAVTVLALSSVVPGASALANGMSISGADLMVQLGAMANAYGAYTSEPTRTITDWYLCDTATSFKSTRTTWGAPTDPSAPITVVTDELAARGCDAAQFVELDLSGNATLAQFYVPDATLYEQPVKPYLTFTVRWTHANLPYAVDALADAHQLRTLNSFPSLTRSETEFSATDATWGPSANNFKSPLAEYWMCNSEVSAGTRMLDQDEGRNPTEVPALRNCRPLYTGFDWEPEAEQFFPRRTTATTLSTNATLYTDAPATEDALPVAVDLAGKNIIRVAMGFPYLTWTGSTPWTAGGDGGVPPTTAPSTTVPPTTAPSTTVPPTTAPSTTVPPTTAPSTTVPSTTVPPSTAPSSTLPSGTPSISGRFLFGVGDNLADGLQVAVKGSGLGADAQFRVEVRSPPVVIGAGTTSSEGRLSGTYTLPTSLPASTLSVWLVSRTTTGDTIEERIGTFTVDVDGRIAESLETPTTSAPPSGGGTLPTTGSSGTTTTAFAAAVLLVIGGLIVSLARRRSITAR